MVPLWQTTRRLVDESNLSLYTSKRVGAILSLSLLFYRHVLRILKAVVMRKRGHKRSQPPLISSSGLFLFPIDDILKAEGKMLCKETEFGYGW
jgi:hypothetical protein